VSDDLLVQASMPDEPVIVKPIPKETVQVKLFSGVV
jgi:hypothetical protein